GGGVQPIPCSVWDAVFQDLDTTNSFKCIAGSNTTFDEIIFFYPSKSGGTGECDKYAKVQVVGDQYVWDYGTLGRSAWIDQSVIGPPIGAITTGTIYQHETGFDADGSALTPSMRTGYYVIGEGEDVAFVDYLLPDFKYGFFNGSATASIQITLYSAME